MNLDIQKIVEYETVIPHCIQSLSSAMPGVHTVVRDNLVLINSKEYPALDINRAFLLRETPEKIDDLIDEVIAYFKDGIASQRSWSPQPVLLLTRQVCLKRALSGRGDEVLDRSWSRSRTSELQNRPRLWPNR
jgi:hypothetical protein